MVLGFGLGAYGIDRLHMYFTVLGGSLIMKSLNGSTCCCLRGGGGSHLEYIHIV